MIKKFIIILGLLLAGISLFTGPFAGVLSMAVCILFGAITALNTHQNKIRTAALVPIVPSILLQVLYFLDQGKYFSPVTVCVLAIMNVLFASGFGALGGLIGVLIQKYKKGGLGKILAIIFLAVLVFQNATPFVLAESTQVTSDDFIQNYDPKNTYTTKTKPMLTPVNRMPKEGLNNLTTEQLHQYCVSQGFAIGETACNQFTPPALPPIENQNPYPENVFPKMVKAVQNKISGKKTKSDGKKQLSLKDQAVGFGKGIWDTGKSLAGIVVKAPVQIYSWAKNNPKQAQVLLRDMMNPVQGIYDISKWTYDNRKTIATTAMQLKQAGDKYGWGNVVKAALFSPEAVDAWGKGEYGYAIGRGMSEFALNIVTLTPPALAAKVPLIGEKLAVGINLLNKANDVLTGAKALEGVAEGAVVVSKGTLALLKTTEKGETALAKTVENTAAMRVINTVVQSSHDTKYAAEVEKIAAKSSKSEYIISKFVRNTEEKAASLAIKEEVIKTTSTNLANMERRGSTYNNAFTHIDTAIAHGSISGKEAETFISTAANNKGIQTLVSDSAKPAVTNYVTEIATQGSSKQIAELDTLGKHLEAKKIKPIAVKTFADGSSEILTVDKAGKAAVHMIGADGAVLSKSYVAKDVSEAGFMHAFMSEPGSAVGAGSRGGVVGDSEGMIARGGGGLTKQSNSNQTQYVVKQNNLPRKAETSVAKGTLLDPSYAKKVDYTPEQLKKLEAANQYSVSGAHIESKHIGKNDWELILRSILENKPKVSSFDNDVAFTIAVNGALKDDDNITKISNWLNGNGTNNLPIRFKSENQILGKVYNRNTNMIRESKDALIVLKKKPDYSGYYILTSYVE